MDARAIKRKPNWTDTEQIVMLDSYAKYKDVLGCHSTPSHEKNKCWLEITKQLNQLNSVLPRSFGEVKRKWHNLLGQGRRDFFDWKQACQNPNKPPGPTLMPAISRRVLELHGGFTLDDGSIQIASDLGEEEFTYVEVGSSVSEDRGTVENLDFTDTEDPQSNDLAPDCVKRECLSPQVHVIDDSSEASAYQTPTPLNATPSISTAFRDSTASRNPTVHTPPSWVPPCNPAPLTSHAVQPSLTNDAQTSGSRNCISAASPFPNQSTRYLSPRHITSPPLVSMTTISNISSSVDPSVFRELPSLLSPETNPQNSEPQRKRVRLSEAGVSERGAGHHAEREAELRLDILQLEKDKLWLETEKLRLEIDILRKQKQQMNSNF